MKTTPEQRAELRRIANAGPITKGYVTWLDRNVGVDRRVLANLLDDVEELKAERKRLWDALHKIAHQEAVSYLTSEREWDCEGCQDMIDIAREATLEQ